MTTVQINTAQNVTLNYEIASVGARILAGILDYIFIWTYLFLNFYMIDSVGWDNLERWHFILMYLPVLFYHFILELVFNGQSFGKMIAKIKVVKADGSQAGIGSYFLRWIFGLFEIWMTSGLIALLASLINGKGQRLGDLAAKTRVISLKPKASLSGQTIFRDVPENYQLQYPQVKKLSDKDVEIITQAYSKALRDKNYKLINILADKVKATTGIETDMPAMKFIETVLKDYSHMRFDG